MLISNYLGLKSRAGVLQTQIWAFELNLNASEKAIGSREEFFHLRSKSRKKMMINLQH